MRTIILILTFCPIMVIAQNTLWLTYGKQIKIADYKIESKEQILYKDLKGRNKSVYVYDVFSIMDSSGTEKIIYTPDTSYKGAFSIPEMKDFVLGQYDAGLNYKSPWTGIGGFALGAVSPQILNPMFVILISAGYCTGVGLVNPKEKNLNIPAEFANNEHYKLGYKKAVKHKRIKNSIIGSGIGILVGMGTYIIVNNSN